MYYKPVRQPNATHRFFLMSLSLLAWAAVAPIVLAEDKAPAKKGQGQTFMGRIEGATEDCQCAVVIDGKNVLAYICSQDEKFNERHTRWFRGTCTEGKITATSPDGVKLAGEREGDKVSVSVKEEKATLRANLSLVERGTEVGLWRAVVKLDDGSELVIGYMIREGEGSVEERMSGAGLRRSKKSKSGPKLGRLSLRELLALSKKNSRMKQANLLRLRLKQLKQLAALLKQQQELQQQEEVEVAAQEVEEVAAEDEAAAAEEAAAEEAAAAEEEAKAKEKSKSKKKPKGGQ